MNPQEIIDLFAEGIEVEPSTLTGETVIADVPEWNSLGWLTIMSLLDEKMRHTAKRTADSRIQNGWRCNRRCYRATSN
jgi:hypothetical protein